MYQHFGKRLSFLIKREQQPLISEIPLTPTHWYENFCWEKERYHRCSCAGHHPLDSYERFFHINRVKVLESGVIPVEIPLCSELELKTFMEVREQALKVLAIIDVLNTVIERSPEIDTLEEALTMKYGYGKTLKEIKDILAFCQAYDQDPRNNSFYIPELEVRDNALFQVHKSLFDFDMQ